MGPKCDDSSSVSISNWFLFFCFCNIKGPLHPWDKFCLFSSALAVMGHFPGPIELFHSCSQKNTKNTVSTRVKWRVWTLSLYKPKLQQMHALLFQPSPKGRLLEFHSTLFPPHHCCCHVFVCLFVCTLFLHGVFPLLLNRGIPGLFIWPGIFRGGTSTKVCSTAAVGMHYWLYISDHS